jgi:hypothetical protein
MSIDQGCIAADAANSRKMAQEFVERIWAQWPAGGDVGRKWKGWIWCWSEWTGVRRSNA